MTLTLTLTLSESQLSSVELVGWLVGWRVTEFVSQSVTELLRFSRCELLLWEAGSGGWGPFGNPMEGERPPLKAVTKQRQWRRDCGHYCVCVCVCNNKLQSVVTRCISNSSINPITNPKPVYSHTHTRDNTSFYALFTLLYLHLHTPN
jgi:hypothetical protein